VVLVELAGKVVHDGEVVLGAANCMTNSVWSVTPNDAWSGTSWCGASAEALFGLGSEFNRFLLPT